MTLLRPHRLADAELDGQPPFPPGTLQPKPTLWPLSAVGRGWGSSMTLGGMPPWSHLPSTPPPSVSRWVTEEWGPCSRSCGKLGVQTRGVQCLLPLPNGTHKAVPAKACPGDRPEARRPCLRVPCPAQWRTGAWSQVSRPQRVAGAGPRGTFSGVPGRRSVWMGDC